jgi:hypothetical protein
MSLMQAETPVDLNVFYLRFRYLDEVLLPPRQLYWIHLPLSVKALPYPEEASSAANLLVGLAGLAGCGFQSSSAVPVCRAVTEV